MTATIDTPLPSPATAAPATATGLVDRSGDRAFLRTRGYLPAPEDPEIPADLMRRHGLRPGDLVTGTVRDVSGRGGKGRRLTGVEQAPPARRPHFAELTPVHPRERLRLESRPEALTARLIDLLAPIGKGQRGLLVAPPKAGKTVVLKAVADALTRNHPECHLMAVLVDERPEEVTDMARAIRGEVLASTFDRPPHDHIALADLAVERAKRLAESGRDVVILLDSLTRLCRAHNNALAHSGRTLSGGVDAAAVHPPKRLFGAARSLEEGGSLTILATALVETGSRADDYFFEELKSTGNMELRLDRALAEQRVFPAIDAAPSGTRREEALLSPAELDGVRRLRRALAGPDRRRAMTALHARLRATASNAEFLRGLTAPSARP